MTERTDRTPEQAGITAAGIGAVIPVAIIAAILNQQPGQLHDAVTVDARALQISVSPEAVVTMLRSLQPDRAISVSFETGAIRVTVADLPPVRIEIPPEGLRLSVAEDGVRVGG